MVKAGDHLSLFFAGAKIFLLKVTGRVLLGLHIIGRVNSLYFQVVLVKAFFVKSGCSLSLFIAQVFAAIQFFLSLQEVVKAGGPLGLSIVGGIDHSSFKLLLMILFPLCRRWYWS